MRKFRPLPADHPLVGKTCEVCGELFNAGDETTLCLTVPADKEEAKKAQAGRPFISCAELVHWECRVPNWD
jgi:hypothetical protein